MNVSLLFEFVTEGTKHAIKSTSLSLFNMLTAQMASSYDENATFPAKAAAHAENAIHDLRMKSGDCKYIWQASDWPIWRFDLAALAGPIGRPTWLRSRTGRSSGSSNIAIP